MKNDLRTFSLFHLSSLITLQLTMKFFWKIDLFITICYFYLLGLFFKCLKMKLGGGRRRLKELKELGVWRRRWKEGGGPMVLKS